MEFRDFLVLLAHGDGSDLFLTSGASPSGKFQGKIIPLEVGKLTPGRIRDIAYGIMNEKQRAEFEVKPEMNLAIQEKGIGRFRVNIFKQRNSVAMVVRNIKTDIPSMETLGLPPILKDVILSKRGLVLFVGGYGFWQINLIGGID